MNFDFHTSTFNPAAINTSAKATCIQRPTIFPESRLPNSTEGMEPTSKLDNIHQSTILANR